jgi:radical SAM superfamily enzyme YgiQ (UPF0313 family)
LGAYRLATELRKNGYSVTVVDHLGRWLQEPKEFYKLINKIVSSQTLFIGFSGTFFTSNNSKTNTITNWREYRGYSELDTWPVTDAQMDLHVKWIKKSFPQVSLVYGGLFSKSKGPSLYNMMDYVVIGLADTTIIELANHLSKGTSLKYMPTNGQAKLIDHDIVASSFDFPHSVVSYQPEDHIFTGEVLPIETSRGCLFKCSFCSYPLLGRKKGDPEYHKNTKKLAEEFRLNFEKYQVNKYMFVDDTFNETTDKIKEIIKARDLSGVDIRFSCYLRTDLIARFPEQIELLKELGIETAFLGIESLYKPSAMAIGKSSDPDKIKTTIQQMKNVWGPEVKIFGSFIVGLPQDNPETLATWIDWVADKNCPIDYPYFVPLGITSGDISEIDKNPAQFGYSIDNKNQWYNQYWDFSQAKEYADSLMQKFWENGRIRLAGFDIIGYQNYGYTLGELNQLTLDTLDFELLKRKKYQQWNSYKTSVFNYENIL